ncbi:MAG: phosphopyruvate hydratase [Gaiellaceae bacterium]
MTTQGGRAEPTAGAPATDLLTTQTVRPYLQGRGVLAPHDPVAATTLDGGVSCVVLDVRSGPRRLIVKQALPQLRVAEEWLANRERTISEGRALGVAAGIDPRRVPAVVDLDAERIVLTIEAAPLHWTAWKTRLLAGDADPDVAARLGAFLGALHRATAGDPEIKEAFPDAEPFDQLRVDPYYRAIIRKHPSCAGAIELLVESMLETRTCLVHGDYSPKNVLVGDDGVWVIDFEVAHVGDPAFDVAFMLSHLFLKGIHVPAAGADLRECGDAFWSAYEESAGDGQSLSLEYVLGHVGCLMLARVDGKSPAEYLDGEGQRAARALGLRLLLDTPGSISDVHRTISPRGGRHGERISRVTAREVLDSRGRPTVEAAVELVDGSFGRASVPSGASVGAHEAHELRDGDADRFGGLGVTEAVRRVIDVIAADIHGREATDQQALDDCLIELDGTPDLSRLGANATLAVSLAVARAAASSRGMSLWRYIAGESEVTLPVPMVNIFSGGLHAVGGLVFQDFLVIPRAADRFATALETAVTVRDAAGRILRAKGMTTLKADEGGFAAESSPEATLDLLEEAARGCGLLDSVGFALDVAATHFHGPDGYLVDGEHLSSTELVDRLEALVEEYPIVSIEDGVAEDDWDGWKMLTDRLGSRVQLIGDDLFTTNVDRLRRGIDEHVANAVLVKPNQAGTLSAALDVVRLAKSAGYATIASARSGETEDAFLADLAVGVAAGQIKVGSTAQSERLAKYNRLLEIEHELGPRAVIGGAPPFFR